MKKLLIFSYLMGVISFSLIAQENTVTNDAELGSRNKYVAACWSMGAVTVSNHNQTMISGDYSLRSNQVTNQSTTATWVKTPWITMEAGKISFKTRLDGNAGGNRSIVLQYIEFDAENESTGEGDVTRFDVFDFPNPINKQTEVHEVAIAVPEELVGSTVKIMFSLVGSGGMARIGMDDFVIPGSYSADPSDDCFPKSEKADADNDGVADSEDAYPEDRYRAFDNFLPATGYGTLMFEDLWPATGDYDFNDLVVDYRLNRVTDAAGDVVEIIIELSPRAAGAGFTNGFGIEFAGLSPRKVIKVSGTKASPESIHKIDEKGLELDNEFATIIPFDRVSHFLTHPGGGALGINTDPDFKLQKPELQTIVIRLKEEGKATDAGPTKLSELGMDNFNPFLIVNQKRGVEVHLPGMKPTRHADESIFGTKEDGSTSGPSSYYRSKENGLPWAMNVPVSIPYMVNKVPITKGYTRFFEWVVSGGESYPDWYLNNGGYRNERVMLNANFQEDTIVRGGGPNRIP
ncbi:LruC domain-containing protein [Cyclobacterium xiamenense]|uniref:LruC domain-containing protein n=1 Tax=Cyclobacterium xiamenense TaxID=1297121 RepID=UPI0012B9F672|nr:LruC domain-containing protein [Cyclobacterium xiamenense]